MSWLSRNGIILWIVVCVQVVTSSVFISFPGDSECITNTCVNGRCVTYTIQECECVSGLGDSQCLERIEKCFLPVCDIGKCNKHSSGRFVCTCLKGWSGGHCDSDDTDCGWDACGIGKCRYSTYRTMCQCDIGWRGETCNEKMFSCNPNPCVHGACGVGTNGYICKCNSGWSGQNCDVEISSCNPNPCVHGACVVGTMGYICKCNSGWSGQNCDVEISSCNPNPCVHGSCVVGTRGYICKCNRGWSGQNCDVAIDGCDLAICVHGTCKLSSDGGVCMCDRGWTGLKCDEEVQKCTSELCGNGECYEEDDVYKCKCKPRWTGVNCDIAVDRCTTTSCVNGVCYEEDNVYKCKCNTGWTGVYCDNEVEECKSMPCVNGVCYEEDDVYECKCNTGWTGVDCSEGLTTVAAVSSDPKRHESDDDSSNHTRAIASGAVGIVVLILATILIAVCKRIKRKSLNKSGSCDPIGQTGESEYQQMYDSPFSVISDSNVYATLNDNSGEMSTKAANSQYTAPTYLHVEDSTSEKLNGECVADSTAVENQVSTGEKYDGGNSDNIAPPLPTHHGKENKQTTDTAESENDYHVLEDDNAFRTTVQHSGDNIEEIDLESPEQARGQTSPVRSSQPSDTYFVLENDSNNGAGPIISGSSESNQAFQIGNTQYVNKEQSNTKRPIQELDQYGYSKMPENVTSPSETDNTYEHVPSLYSNIDAYGYAHSPNGKPRSENTDDDGDYSHTANQ